MVKVPRGRYDWTGEPVSALQLSVRAQRCVESVGVVTIGQLCDLSEDEFLAARGFGETALREVRAKLAGLGLRMRHPSEPARFARRPRTPRPDDPALRAKLAWSLAELNLSVRAVNSLEAAGLVTVGDIVARTPEELSELPAIDAGIVVEVSERLAERGLHLSMKPPTVC